MKFNIYINNEEINVEFSKNRGLKHNYLKIVDEKNIRVKGNYFFTLKDAKMFVDSKITWIEKHITNIQNKKINEHEFYYLGKKETIFEFEHKFNDLNEFYMQKAKDFIPKIVERYSSLMNCYPTSLKFRKNRSRWGSCSYKNSINLNIYLMKLPIEAIEYVVIHELAHINHKNHSKKFWDFVETYCPNYKYIEKILKKY